MSASPAEERQRLEREIRRLRNELQEAVHALPHLRQMVQFSGDLLLLTGPGSRILEANQRVAAVLGVAQAQLYGQSLQQWLVNPAQIEQLEQRLQAMAADAVVRMEVELQPAQGEPLILELEARRLADVATVEPRWTLALRELADQRRLEASRAAQDLQKALVTSVRRSENRVAEFSQRYQVLFEQSLDGLLLLDPAGVLLEANAAAAGLFGVGDVNALLQLRLMALAPDRQPGGAPGGETVAQLLAQAMAQGHAEGECWQRRLDGDKPWLARLSVRRLDFDGGPRLLLCVRDVSEARRYEDRLRSLAYEDQLTHLANRAAALAWIEAHLQRPGQGPQVLLWLDLDGFGRLNLSFGRQAGDVLLKTVAEGLRQFSTPEDLLARLGSDEFLLVRTLSGDPEDFPALQREAELILQGLRDHLALLVPETMAAGPWPLGFCAGYSFAPLHGHQADELLEAAATALSRARLVAPGTGLAYRPTFTTSLRRQVELELSLRQALESGQLRLVYQPQCSAEGVLLGAEALLRWEDPVHGTVSPARFIALAERSNLIHPLGQWVLEQACGQLRRWLDTGLKPPRLAVNLSPRQFEATVPPLVEQVRGLLERYCLPRELLELEITEGCILPAHGVSAQVRELADLGVLMALDDFGTGYSSLSALNRLPLHKLKIDRSFIHHLVSSESARTIVRTALAMGRGLGLEVLAEGLETPGQLEVLESLGCDAYQGYWFSPPLEVDDFTALMDKTLRSG